MRLRASRKLIFLLFFISGISGLVYEIVWLRMLSRIMGVTTYATAITLAAFMAGLAFGSFIFGKISDKRRDLLRVYALLQIAIAVTALITPKVLSILLPFQQFIYKIGGQDANLLAVIRVCISFSALFIPATLMGGTLPVLTSYLVKRNKIYGENFSLLYGLNTLGAVGGVLLAGFVTIGFIGEWNTILIGVVLNVIVGVISFNLYRGEPQYGLAAEIAEEKVSVPSDIPISPYPEFVRRIVLLVMLISGFTSLAYEVIWSRQLILFLRTSIYAFSGMLAVFLTGIAVGSVSVNKIVDKLKAPIVAFGILELIVGVLSIVNLYLFRPLDSSLFSQIISPIILVFPMTFLFGAIFPIASLCYAKSVQKSGSSTGTIYCSNTIGNVLGALITGFLFVSILGSSKTVILLGFINVALGLILIWAEPSRAVGFKLKYVAVVPLVILLTLGFRGKDPFLGVIEGRISGATDNYKIFHNKETVEGTVTSFEVNGLKGLYINGMGQTILCDETKLMAHIPVMLAKNPRKILVICFGMGTTVRSAGIYDDVDITAVELVPDVYECFKYYHDDAEEIESREDIDFISEDGRNFLLLSPDKYDVIIIDPSPPVYSAGTVNLYTQEFLELCKEHLTSGGIMCLWFPGGTKYENGAIIKTFYSVFPYATVWLGPRGWGFYLIGGINPLDIDPSKVEDFFRNQKLLDDLSEYTDNPITSSGLLELLRDIDFVKEATRDVPVISDNYPYTEFPLWRYLFKDNKVVRYAYTEYLVQKVLSLNQKAIELGKAGDLDEAISLFSEAVKLDPGYAESHNNLGYAYFLKGEYKRAEEQFKKALEVAPDHERARSNLKYLYDSGYLDRSDKETQ